MTTVLDLTTNKPCKSWTQPDPNVERVCTFKTVLNRKNRGKTTKGKLFQPTQDQSVALEGEFMILSVGFLADLIYFQVRSKFHRCVNNNSVVVLVSNDPFSS